MSTHRPTTIAAPAGRHRPGHPLVEREAVRRGILARRPALEARLHDGPSGSLVIPVPGGRGIEIGRLPYAGGARWVVVVPAGDGVRVRVPRALGQIPDLVLAALDGP